MTTPLQQPKENPPGYIPCVFRHKLTTYAGGKRHELADDAWAAE